MWDTTDAFFMQRALDLAASADVQLTRPNPRVGCVLVQNGCVLSEGAHLQCGQAHAEIHALQSLEAKGQKLPLPGVTVYVTLEPCAHTGRTPPCVEALLRLRPARVVVGTIDPNPRVAGQSIARLKAAGIAVTTGVLASACEQLNEGFFHWMCTGKPFLEAKVAVSADWKSAAAPGASRLHITGEAVRRFVHRRRQQHDALVVGVGTLLADRPLLDAREGWTHKKPPALVILDPQGRTPAEGPWWNQNRQTWVVTTELAPTSIQQGWKRQGAETILTRGDTEGIYLEDAWTQLSALGVRSLGIEPGPRLLRAVLPFLQRLFVMQGPDRVGSNARNWIESEEAFSEGIRKRLRSKGLLGADHVWFWERGSDEEKICSQVS